MYSPKIDEKLIPELYRLKQRENKPMTYLVNEAVKEYLKKRKEVEDAGSNCNKGIQENN